MVVGEKGVDRTRKAREGGAKKKIERVACRAGPSRINPDTFQFGVGLEGMPFSKRFNKPRSKIKVCVSKVDPNCHTKNPVDEKDKDTSDGE